MRKRSFSNRLRRQGLSYAIGAGVVLVAPLASATTRYVAQNGADNGDCSTQATPCAKIATAIAAMAGGDTLIIGDGTYTEPISRMPNGTAGAYTTIKAEHDWAVLIDGSGFPNTFQTGIAVGEGHYVWIRGFRVKMNQDNKNNQPIQVSDSDHVKIQRCGASYAPVKENAAGITVGPNSSYVLVEESYSFGGGRYQFLVHHSDHNIMRRNVARNDYWDDVLQCAGFTNYDSIETAWQNNIVLDGDTKDCKGTLYGGFFNENNPDYGPDTTESHKGNIVLNVRPFFAGDYDYEISGTHTVEDMVIWGGSAGYYADKSPDPGPAAVFHATRLTIGANTGSYDGPNGQAANGTGLSAYNSFENTVDSSLFVNNQSLGLADYVTSDYNAFSGNGANYGGAHMTQAGAHDMASVDPAASLKYLVRIEPGSPLKTAGKNGGQVGAEILFRIGTTGTVMDETGWDTLTGEELWPFPNEDQIRNDMASYVGPGGVGQRGFTTGNSKDGTQQTLTKYIWEYLGNEIPPEIYGFHISVASLPAGVINKPYTATVTVGGGTTPYKFSIAGNLPPGLALDAANGAITGTPTQLGDFPFTVTATDSAATPASVDKPLSISITDGSTAAGDGGTGAGAGSDDDSGCGCRTAGWNGGESALAIAGIGAALAIVAARRRRR